MIRLPRGHGKYPQLNLNFFRRSIMTQPESSDTITAVATPRGIGGIAVIRVSGPDAHQTVRSILIPSPFDRAKSHTIYHGWIVDQDEPIDEVLVSYFQAPNSYTGEPVVEISTHGSPFLCQRILNLLLEKGCRIAEPGEFTQRAFLNGKMDLSQAEAVADLIHAQTEAARRVAVYQLEGRLSERIEQMRSMLIENCGLLELELDFAEDDVELTPKSELTSRLDSIKDSITDLLSSFQQGRICREGIRTVILGEPNVGKSSLLNCLLEKERAIVSEIPGTTRDTLEEMIDIEGILFIITDTAGVRKSRHPVEQEGMKRAFKALDQADLILWVIDATQPWSARKNPIWQEIVSRSTTCIGVINKCDLEPNFDRRPLQDCLPNLQIISVSSHTEKGIDQLIQTLLSVALTGRLPQEGDVLITRLRHAQALERALHHLENAARSLADNMSQEFIALDLRGALDALGRITGQTTADDILNQLFSEFCIGK
jgi:tRNA modification GTPase